jgi:hypothetical protein
MADSGTHLDRLKAVADLLEHAIGEAQGAAKGPLAAQFRATLKEIRALEAETALPQEVTTGLDELKARRETRESKPARKARTAV